MDSTAPKRRGPKKRYGARDEVHLKFSKDVLDIIEANAKQGRQAFFDALIEQHIQFSRQCEPIGRDLDLQVTTLQKIADSQPNSYEVWNNQRMQADAALLDALEQIAPLLPTYVQARLNLLFSLHKQIWSRKRTEHQSGGSGRGPDHQDGEKL